MEKIDVALNEFREMDELSARSSCIHGLNSLVKFAITVFYILMVVSYDKYELNRLLVMVIYPAIMFNLSGTSVITFFRKLRYVLPLVMAVGIINPFIDKTPVMNIGTTVITGGVISMITLMLKGVFCLMASYVLVATTRFDLLAASLRKIHVPSVIVTLMLLTYRYISVMMDEVSVMTTAYKLRAPGQKGIHYSAWGSFLGQLLLRSMDRAEELYHSMLLRGFNGNFAYTDKEDFGAGDLVYITLTVSFAVLLKLYDVATILGNFVM